MDEHVSSLQQRHCPVLALETRTNDVRIEASQAIATFPQEWPELSSLDDIVAPTLAVPEKSDDTSPRLDNLPEESLEHIISYLPSQSDIASISAVSRKFHRIAEPALYHTICITVATPGEHYKVPMHQAHRHVNRQYGEFDLPSAKGTNTATLLRSITERPWLGHYVKVLKLFRNDTGHFDRRQLGLFTPIPDPRSKTSIEEIKAAISSGKWLQPPDGFFERVDGLSETFMQLLHRLPCIEHIDASAYNTDISEEPISEEIQYRLGNPLLTPSLAHLRRIQLYWRHHRADDARFVFSLPNLESLHLIALHIYPHLWFYSPDWLYINNCSMKHLFLEDIDMDWTSWNAVTTENLLCRYAKALTQLQVLQITTALPKHLFIVLSAFKAHIPKLRQLEAYSRPPSEPQYIRRGAAAHGDFFDPEAAQAIRVASSLHILRLDIIDLGEKMPLQDFEELRTNTSFDSVLWTEVPGQDCVMKTQLPLPQSIVDLTLHVSDVLHTRLSLAKALLSLAANLQTWTPNLSHVKIVLHPNGAFQNATVLTPEILSAFQSKKVDIEELVGEELVTKVQIR